MKHSSFFSYFYFSSSPLFLLGILCFSLTLLTGCSSSAEKIREQSESPSPVLEREDSLTFHTVELPVPGLEKDYEILFLTDTHAVLPCPSDLPDSSQGTPESSEEIQASSQENQESSQEIQQYSEERIQHFTSESGGIPSADTFSAWKEKIHTMDKNPGTADKTSDTDETSGMTKTPDTGGSSGIDTPLNTDGNSGMDENADIGKAASMDGLTADAILLGGDIIDSPSPVNLELLKSFLDPLSVPYLYTPGNHDWTYPWEYMTDNGRSLYLSELLPYMDQNTSIHSLEMEDLILVAIDNSSNQIHPDALPEYQRLLSLGKPVIVLLHVPLYTASVLEQTMEAWGRGIILGGGVHGGIYPDPVSTEFLSLTTAADSPVSAVLAGHIHLFHQSYIEGEKNILQITGPAGYQGEAVLLRLTKESRDIVLIP